MRKILFIIVFSILGCLLFAQDNTQNKGRIYGDLFLNANYNANKKEASFRLNRLHLAYRYQFSEHLYFNGMVESARENYEPVGGYNDITNLFEFCVGFKLEKLEGKFGLISTQLNQQQEKLWKHRYVDKVFADKYGFAPTNDFGAIMIYKPFKQISLDFAVTNGEGHKNTQADSAFRYAAGITLRATPRIITRLYTDFTHHSDVNHANLIAILGYEDERITLGFEYNQQFNSNYQLDFIRNGISAYVSYNVHEKGQIFGRYDSIESNETNGSEAWNAANDGSLFIGGYQYKIMENLTLALNYRRWACVTNSPIKSFIFFDVMTVF